MFFLVLSLSIYILLLSSADNNRSIYIERDELKKKHYKLPWKGKRVFFGGELLQKMGLGNLLG